MNRLLAFLLVTCTATTFACRPNPYHDLSFGRRNLAYPPSRTEPFNPAGHRVGTSVGELAPEIRGVDLDGIPFKTSDYRGQVVVLNFFGNW